MLQSYLLGTFNYIVLILVAVHRTQAVSICDVYKVSAAAGEITSPGYPGDYEANRNCSLVIDGGSNAKITITFLEIAIEPYEDIPDSCLGDAIVINGKRYCGYELPSPIVSKGNKVNMRFESDDSNFWDEPGFKISYRVEKVSLDGMGQGICPGRYIKDKKSGSLYSPNFPRNYPDRKECKVTVDVPDNYMMHVWFTTFHLQRSLTCEYDWMVVSDEHGGWKMCGGGPNKIPKPIQLTGRSVKLRFKSDSSQTEKGFRLHYNMTKLTEGSCICTQGLAQYVFVHDFKPKIQRAKHTIEFSLKTSESRGLVMFSQGRLRDYIYIYIRYGRLCYETDLGTGRGRVVSIGPRINDNKWHKVLISRKDRTLGMAVDDRLSGAASTRGRFNRLDIPDAVGFFLGAPSTISGLIRNFYGCIRDLRVDGREPITNAFALKPDYWIFGRSRFTKCKL